MNFDLTGIHNQNEYYTNHYLSSIFAENAAATLSAWGEAAKNNSAIKTPWSLLRECSKQYYTKASRQNGYRFNIQLLRHIEEMATSYINALGYDQPQPTSVEVEEKIFAPVFMECKKSDGSPLLWAILSASYEEDTGILESNSFDISKVLEEGSMSVKKDMLNELDNEELATKILFGQESAPRFILFIGLNQIALIDRNKWNEKRYLEFDLDEIFSRHEETTLKAMAVLLHHDDLCPNEGRALIDELDENSQRHAAGVSQDLKYALREAIELLGNEVIYDMKTRLGRDMEKDPVDASQLTLECLRYMYRMLFVLFIEARPELGYAPIKAQTYMSGYSLESLRDIVDDIRADIDDVGDGYYLHETVARLYELIYSGYPETEVELQKFSAAKSLHDMFVIQPLKAHIFDPEYTKMITESRLRNSVMLRIIDLMSLSRPSGRRNERRGRISYANLGINQMGAVYEALLSYRGFIAETTLCEVKRAGDKFNELDVGYFIPETDLGQYTEDERVRYESGENKGKLRKYEKGTFIYRLAGREREKSASYYTPECLTKCLVKYALKELLKDKTADEILQLTVCEPAMGSAAFLNEAINQLAEAYIDKKQKETGETIEAAKRFTELQKVKMYIADRNVYGIDLNPVAVELAEVSLWLNTIFEGGYVPWFGTQLINGNSLIGARRQCYTVEDVKTKDKGERWYEKAPERVLLTEKRKPKKQIYHFLLGDPGMCAYDDKVIKSLEPANIKKMKEWTKEFNKPLNNDEVDSLLILSQTIDELWEKQIRFRKELEVKTRDVLSVFGHEDEAKDSHTSIRQKDAILTQIYKSEHAKNAGPYARLKFAMDYWCALWFWPIEKAELLPTRSEFINEMNLILVGTMPTNSVQKTTSGYQFSLFGGERDDLMRFVSENLDSDNVVDLDFLCSKFERMALVKEIANNNKFMHWELEFADLFAERGGFDLIIGNPPWVKLEWSEQFLLSEKVPLFVIREMDANTILKYRDNLLTNRTIRNIYFKEFIHITGQRIFLNGIQNYEELKGQQSNLFKCFIPLAWRFTNKKGYSAFIHPNGPFDDSAGDEFRKKIYPKLKYHFRFMNKKQLFSDVSTSREFSLNIYSNISTNTFDMMSNLITTDTIDCAYEKKDPSCISRIIKVNQKVLDIFARLSDSDRMSPRIVAVNDSSLINLLLFFEKECDKDCFYTEMWHETNSQKNGILKKNIDFPDRLIDMIYSGNHIGVANPYFKTPRRNGDSRYDFDPIDLTVIPIDYRQRSKFCVAITDEKQYFSKVISIQSICKYNYFYRLAMRKMLSSEGERTLMAAIIPPYTGHIDGIFGVFCGRNLLTMAAGFASIIFDFYIKVTGKSNCRADIVSNLPSLSDSLYNKELSLRALLLNCLTIQYANLWHSSWDDIYLKDTWSKNDNRLNNNRFYVLSPNWSHTTPVRSDYERRQALVEIDVLVALSLGMKLKDLKDILTLKFRVLKKIENDTWYDSNGRIIFTPSTNLPGVGLTRPEFEKVKDSSPGTVIKREIEDDTMPGGPIKRTIEYVAPFDRCDREKDYETAWAFFEAKYGKQK